MLFRFFFGEYDYLEKSKTLQTLQYIYKTAFCVVKDSLKECFSVHALLEDKD